MLTGDGGVDEICQLVDLGGGGQSVGGTWALSLPGSGGSRGSGCEWGQWETFWVEAFVKSSRRALCGPHPGPASALAGFQAREVEGVTDTCCLPGLSRGRVCGVLWLGRLSGWSVFLGISFPCGDGVFAVLLETSVSLLSSPTSCFLQPDDPLASSVSGGGNRVSAGGLQRPGWPGVTASRHPALCHIHPPVYVPLCSLDRHPCVLSSW